MSCVEEQKVCLEEVIPLILQALSEGFGWQKEVIKDV